MRGRKPLLLIYHAQCLDGFACLVIASGCRAADEIQAWPARYGEDPPDVKGRDVLICDFSWPRDVLVRMHGEAKSLRVLDHHESAEKALGGLDWCTFDMERSGAALTWEHFHPGVEPPEWVRLIEDGDLWRFRHGNLTRAWQARFLSLGWRVHAWRSELERDRESITDRGYACLDLIDAEVKALGLLAREVRWPLARRGPAQPVVVANSGPLHRSFVLKEALDRFPDAVVAVAYWQDEKGRWEHSIRSRKDGPNVAEIAEQLGGGGHRHAAGWISREPEFPARAEG